MGSSFQELRVEVGTRLENLMPTFILQEKELPTHIQQGAKHAMPLVTTSSINQQP